MIATLDEDGQPIDGLAEGQTGYVALDRTPFYVESGGQVSDIGTLASDAGALALVRGLVKAGADRPRLHRVRVTAGELQPRDTVVAAVDDQARDATRRNHTATHLLHAALRQVLGSHVKQGGSLVSPDRLRFDFAHDSALTAEQLEQVESIVNEQIRKNTPVRTELKSTDEAVAAGAMALFGEKYGDTVRVVSVPGFSMELCGGTHVTATGDIGLFTIVQEGGVAAGVRRIEALTGAGALALHQAQRRSLDSVLAALKAPADQAEAAIERLNAEAKTPRQGERSAEDEGRDGRRRDRRGRGRHGRRWRREDGGAGASRGSTRRLSASSPTPSRTRCRAASSSWRPRHDGRVTIVVSVTKDLVPRVHAGNIVKKIAPLVGGGGGGRPDFAEAGGKNPAGIDAMLAEARAVVSGMARQQLRLWALGEPRAAGREPLRRQQWD